MLLEADPRGVWEGCVTLTFTRDWTQTLRPPNTSLSSSVVEEERETLPGLVDAGLEVTVGSAWRCPRPYLRQTSLIDHSACQTHSGVKGSCHQEAAPGTVGDVFATSCVGLCAQLTHQVGQPDSSV